MGEILSAQPIAGNSVDPRCIVRVVPSEVMSLEWHMASGLRDKASKELVFVIEDADEGGYTAKALGASIFTEADTIDELRDQIRDAVRCHFDEGEGPAVIRLHFVREEVIAP